jgi:hypothetical protein
MFHLPGNRTTDENTYPEVHGALYLKIDLGKIFVDKSEEIKDD